MILRDYQLNAEEGLREGIRTHPSREPGLLVAPTGSGKSEIFADMTRKAVAKGKRVVAVVNRRILVNDLCKRVARTGLEYGVIMGGAPSKVWAKVHVASFDTLWRRERLPRWDLAFIDECHFSLAPTYAKAIQRLHDSGAIIIGMTATPIRGAGEGLGDTYKWMVRCPDTPDLIDRGYLVQPRIFAPDTPDLKGVGTVAGEYNQKQLAAACNSIKLTGNILEYWLKWRGRPTIAFGVDIKHCQDMAAQFVQAGVRAVAVDHTYKGDFDEVWRKLQAYETEVVFNVGIAGYGWDAPRVSCMIEARPTRSLGLWLQHCGRVMRTAPGKVDAIILDHAGNSHEHGLPDWPRDWTLDGVAARRPGCDDPAPPITTCKHAATVDGVLKMPCYATFKTGPRECPYCGLPLVKVGREIEQVDGALSEVGRQPRVETEKQKAHRLEFQEWERIGLERGYKPGWATMQYKQKYGDWPLRRAWSIHAALAQKEMSV